MRKTTITRQKRSVATSQRYCNLKRGSNYSSRSRRAWSDNHDLHSPILLSSDYGETLHPKSWCIPSPTANSLPLMSYCTRSHPSRSGNQIFQRMRSKYPPRPGSSSSLDSSPTSLRHSISRSAQGTRNAQLLCSTGVVTCRSTCAAQVTTTVPTTCHTPFTSTDRPTGIN